MLCVLAIVLILLAIVVLIAGLVFCFHGFDVGEWSDVTAGFVLIAICGALMFGAVSSLTGYVDGQANQVKVGLEKTYPGYVFNVDETDGEVSLPSGQCQWSLGWNYSNGQYTLTLDRSKMIGGGEYSLTPSQLERLKTICG